MGRCPHAGMREAFGQGRGECRAKAGISNADLRGICAGYAVFLGSLAEGLLNGEFWITARSESFDTNFKGWRRDSTDFL